MRWLTLLLALAACDPGPTDCITPSGVVLDGCEPFESWTHDVADRFAESSCDDVRACDVLAVLRYSADNGLPAHSYWTDPPLSTGRYIQATDEAAWKHELTHALIDGCGLAGWDQAEHHALMDRCRLQ